MQAERGLTWVVKLELGDAFIVGDDPAIGCRFGPKIGGDVDVGRMVGLSADIGLVHVFDGVFDRSDDGVLHFGSIDESQQLLLRAIGSSRSGYWGLGRVRNTR